MKILSIKDLGNQLRKKEIAPVYTLFGAETFLRDLAAKTIVELVLKESSLREFNETAFSLDETELQHALASAEQLPMMTERRVVQITNVKIAAASNRDNLKEEKEQILASYLSNPSQTSVVIFIGDEIDKRRKVSKLLLENSTAVEFKLMEGNELANWVKDKFREFGATADEKALNYLIGLVGGNLRKLNTEIEKLAIAALPDTLVTYELVKELIPNTKEMSNFVMTDNLVSRKKSHTLQDLKKVLDDGAEPLMLLGLIAHHFRRQFSVKELMNQGVDRREVAKIMRLPYGKQEDFLADARRTETETFSKILRRIAETDLAIKTSKATPRLQIEILFCELLEM